jgi:hypothetical protein
MIKSQKDFFSGLMFTAAGVAFAVGAQSYTVGTAARMGPGYFPLMLGIILAILGVAITFNALVVHTEDGDKVGHFVWKPIIFVLGANLAFGILLGGLPSIGLPPMGLMLAIVVLTFIASLAGDEFKLRDVAILSVVLAIGSYVAFIWLLKLNMPVWPTFITG